MPGNVQHVIDTSHDPEVTILIAVSGVTRQIIFSMTDIVREIGFSETFRITPQGAYLRRKGFFDHQETAFTAFDIMTGLVNNGRENSRQRKRAGTGFERDCTWCWRDHMATGFRLPPGIDNGATRPPYFFIKPHPGFRIDRFPDRTQ